MNRYDLAIDGSDLGAWALANLAARHGRSVVVCHDDRVGAGHFPYCFDPRNGALQIVLDQLGLTDRLPAKPLSNGTSYRLGGIRYDRETDWEAAIASLADQFPQEREALRQYGQTMRELGQEWHYLLRCEGPVRMDKIRLSARYRKTGYREFLDSLLNDPCLCSLLMLDAPHPEVALVVMAGYLTTQLADAHEIEGGAARLLALLQESFASLGGRTAPARIKTSQPAAPSHLCLTIPCKSAAATKKFCHVVSEGGVVIRYYPGFHPDVVVAEVPASADGPALREQVIGAWNRDFPQSPCGPAVDIMITAVGNPDPWAYSPGQMLANPFGGPATGNCAESLGTFGRAYFTGAITVWRRLQKTSVQELSGGIR